MPKAHSPYCKATCIWPHECVSMSYSYHIKLSCALRAPGQVDPPNHLVLLADSIHIIICCKDGFMYTVRIRTNCNHYIYFRLYNA